MASLLYPDDDASGGLLMPPDDRPPVLQPDPRADALGQMYRFVSDYMARQQAQSEAQGYWSGGSVLEGGHPTGKALLDAIQQAGTAVALGTGGPGERPPPGFTVYHGSPHSFDAFSNDAIGSGEGAQAFGYGHYTAEAEGVARGYRDQLGPQSDPAVQAAGREFNAAHLAFDGSPEAKARVDAAERALQQAEANAPPGHMYEVNVSADPEHFLHWDKPISQQHPMVQQAVNSIADNSVALSQRMMDAQKNNIPLTGQDVVSALVREGKFNDPRIAQALQQAGVPGIRYLDQGSRGAGDGTHNVVVFDPATMNIIRRYGLAGLMAGGGVAALGGQQRQEQ